MAEPGIAEKVLAAVNILNDPEKTEDAPIQPPALNVTRVGGLAAFIASAGAAALTLFNIEKTDDIALRIAAIAGTAVIVAVSLIAAAIIIAADVRARSTVVASPSEESDESTEKETIDKYITAFDEALRDAERNGHVHPADADDLLDLIRLKNAYHAMALTLEELEAPAEFVDENNYLRTEAEGISEEAGKVAALPKAKDKRQSARAILRRVLEFRAEAAAKLREL